MDGMNDPWGDLPKVDAESVRLAKARADEKDRQDHERDYEIHRKKMRDDERETGSGPKVFNGNRPADAGKRAEEIKRALVPLDQIKPILHQSYLIKGWLDHGAASVLYGESNVGKTFLALDMGLHVAAGWLWHGVRVTEACPVIYIASEGGRGVKNRLDAVWRDKPDLARAAVGRFHLLPVTLDLCAKGDAPAVIVALRSLPDMPGLIIIDTLARSMGAGDENTGQDMGAFIASVDQIRAATGAHVMVIHHSGKDTSKGARGHSSLRAAVDTEIGLKREGQIITAEDHKQRDGVSGKTFNYTLRSVYLGDDQDGDPITSCVVEPAEAQGKTVKTGLSPKLKQSLDTFLTAKRRAGVADDLAAGIHAEDWRAVFYEASTADSQDNKKKDFQGMRTALVSAGSLSVSNDIYRLARVPE